MSATAMSRWARETWTGWMREAREGRPAEEVGQRWAARAISTGKSVVSFALSDFNGWLLARSHGHLPSVWDTADWPWIAEVEARQPEIKVEVERFLARTTMPHVAVMSGVDPDSDEGKMAVPGIKGTWRALLLHTCGRWLPETADHFPTVRACFPDMRHKANLGFSLLEPRSHIEPHVGENRGILRLQIPIIVPGQPGDCRIRVGEEVIVWEEGKAVVFDLSTNHEAWNDAESLRVLLMVEIELPLPQPWRSFNRLAQLGYRWHPSYRQMPERVAAIARSIDQQAERAREARAAVTEVASTV